MTLDISLFEKLSDGDRDGCLKLMELYLDKTSEQILKLKNALGAGSSAEVGRIAHSMIGANLMVGMTSMVPALRQLEGYAERGDLAKGVLVFDKVAGQFETIRITLEKIIQASPNV